MSTGDSPARPGRRHPVDGVRLPADLVIDASGRAGRATRSLRPAATSGGPCGIAYVDRQYQLHRGAEPGPLLNPIAWQADFDGYQAMIFLHEHGIFSVLLVRPTADRVLSQLRHEAAFTAACRAIPGLADWVDPDRARPITAVLPGGPLLNAYRGQTGHDGRLALPGLVFVGDAVATTTPTFGRGITTTMLQAQQLLQLTDEHGTDTDALGESFDAWCTDQIKPWVDDHVQMDEATRRRWAARTSIWASRCRPTSSSRPPRPTPASAPVTVGYLRMTAPPSRCAPSNPALARFTRAAGAPGPHQARAATNSPTSCKAALQASPAPATVS